MKTWEMHVYCRRNGVTRDGGLHRTFGKEPTSDKEVEPEEVTE